MHPGHTKFARYEPDGRRREPIEFSVRVPRKGDVPAVAELVWEREGGTLEEHLHGAAREIELLGAEAPARVLLIAETDGVLVGFARASYNETPDGATAEDFPAGWYLGGLIVASRYRRCGIGLRLTEQRISWLAGRADVIRYFATLENRVSIDLHAKLGFRVVRRGIVHPHLHFAGGVGALFELRLAGRQSRFRR